MTDTRDWFPSPEEPNPMRAAQAGMKPTLPKRFYKQTGVEERDGAFVLTLDGRTARTPGRQLIAVPSRALAAAVEAVSPRARARTKRPTACAKNSGVEVVVA